MPAPKRRKQRVAIALEQQKQQSLEAEEAKKADAIRALKQSQKRTQVIKETEPVQKRTKTKRAKAAPKKRRTK